MILSIKTISSAVRITHHLAHVPAFPESSGGKLRWLQVQQDREEPLLYFKFSLSLHRARKPNVPSVLCFTLLSHIPLVTKSYSPKNQQFVQTDTASYPLMEK